jgi:dUTP pyrophosphatase
MNYFATLMENLRSFAVLKIAVNPNKPELVELYKSHIEKHNASIITDPFPNSGFDLFVPETTEVTTDVKMISMDVKCEMLDKEGYSAAYYMYPRSSLSKTPLMLANHVGIIDSGYRGFLIGAFRGLNLAKPYAVEKNTRLLQICHPSLCPLHVIMVDESELSDTSRGAGGFGSTGK